MLKSERDKIRDTIVENLKEEIGINDTISNEDYFAIYDNDDYLIALIYFNGKCDIRPHISKNNKIEKIINNAFRIYKIDMILK